MDSPMREMNFIDRPRKTYVARLADRMDLNAKEHALTQTAITNIVCLNVIYLIAGPPDLFAARSIS